MKAMMTIVAAGAIGLGLSGCLVGRHHDHYGDDRHYHNSGGVEVVVPVGHIHDDHCGHYYHRDRWYHHSRHRHGRDCGHVFIGGRWTHRH